MAFNLPKTGSNWLRPSVSRICWYLLTAVGKLSYLEMPKDGKQNKWRFAARFVDSQRKPSQGRMSNLHKITIIIIIIIIINIIIIIIINNNIIIINIYLHLIIFSLESQPPNLPTCSACDTAFPARGVAISFRKAEAMGRPTMATADQQRPATWRLRFKGLEPQSEIVWVAGIWFLVTEKKTKDPPQSFKLKIMNLQVWNEAMVAKSAPFFRNAMCLWKTHEAGGRDGRFPQT